MLPSLLDLALVYAHRMVSAVGGAVGNEIHQHVICICDYYWVNVSINKHTGLLDLVLNDGPF